MNSLMRGTWWQRARLVTGLILLVFAASHFANHALGLVSVETMLAAQDARLALTRSAAGSAVLAGALLVHAGLGVAKLLGRTTLRMPLWEAAQIGLALAIPVLLLPHVVHTRIAHEVFAVDDSYLYQLARLWPDRAVGQSVLLAVVWLHGCVGLHFWLRLRSWYRAVAPVLLSLAVALPLMALAGFTVAARQVATASRDPGYLAALKLETNWPQETANAALVRWADLGVGAVYIALAAIALLFAGRFALRRYWSGIEVDYAYGPRVRAPAGPTLLEISRMFGVPHAAVCGGRARCSTCRVQVRRGLDRLAPPGRAEAETLASIGAAADVRLACQIRPRSSLEVLRLVRPGRVRRRAGGAGDEAHGVERTAVVLFLDLRGFSTLSEDRLPYDVIHLLNSFFDEAGRAIVACGGHIDKYLGDGLMAVFDEAETAAAVRQALQAAHDIDLAMDRVNERLAGELTAGLRLGIGIDVGPLVMGRIGHGELPPMTVIGRTVNTASRLEQLTKELQVQLVLSGTAAELVRLDDGAFDARDVEIRGLNTPIRVVAVRRARDLAEFLTGTNG